MATCAELSRVRLALRSSAVASFALMLASSAQAQIFVSDWRAGLVGEYNASGAAINAHFASGLVGPYSITWDGLGNLFVADDHVIREYSISGTTVNASLISGLPDTWGIACDGNGHLFVSLSESGSVAEYTTAGAVVNATLISGISPTVLALDGLGHLFVADINGFIREYSTSGAVVNASLISGLTTPEGLALDGNGHLFVSSYGNSFTSQNVIGEYNLDGSPVNATLITSTNYSQYFNGLTLDGNGHLLVADAFYGAIREYNLNGTPVNTALVTGLTAPMSLVVVPEPSIARLSLIGLAWLLRRRSDISDGIHSHRACYERRAKPYSRLR